MAFDDTKFSILKDFGKHKISYTVTSVHYPLKVTQVQGTFEYEVSCPKNVLASTVMEAMQSFSYDLSSGVRKVVARPQITFVPNNCFTTATYRIIDVSTGSAVDYMKVVDSGIEIYSTDLRHLGIKTLVVSAILSNNQSIGSHTFTVDLFSSKGGLTCDDLSMRPYLPSVPNKVYTIDLLGDYTEKISLPLLVPNVQNCYQNIEWGLVRVSDGVDMVKLLPSVFNITGSFLQINVTKDDSEARVNLRGQD